MIMDILRSVLSRHEPAFTPDPLDWRRNRKKTEDCIRASGLFNATWYLDQYPDVRYAKIDPLFHFLNHGGAERRNPSAAFNSLEYVRRYPDAASGHPLLHFLRYRDERQLTAPRVGETADKRAAPPASHAPQRLPGGHAQGEIFRPADRPANYALSGPYDIHDYDFPSDYGDFAMSHGYGARHRNEYFAQTHERGATGGHQAMPPWPGYRVEAGSAAYHQPPEHTFSALEMQQIKWALAPLGLSVDETPIAHIPPVGTPGARPVANTGSMDLRLKRNGMPHAQLYNAW